MDKIRVMGITCEVRLGVSEGERSQPQKVAFDLTLELDLDPSANTDELELTVDYHELSEQVGRAARERPFRLLESLAKQVCSTALSHPRVESVTVTARKWPAPLQDRIDCVEVEMTRSR